jgi:hypothetical protein
MITKCKSLGGNKKNIIFVSNDSVKGFGPGYNFKSMLFGVRKPSLRANWKHRGLVNKTMFLKQSDSGCFGTTLIVLPKWNKNDNICKLWFTRVKARIIAIFMVKTGPLVRLLE